jgi:cob(I)alamin adenosyltransferase
LLEPRRQKALAAAQFKDQEAAMTDTETDINQAHREKMAKVKAAKDKIYASKTKEKGLLMVHTGTGKGKSTAAFGLVMRTLGHGLNVGVVQFVKGRRETGERQMLEKFPEQVTVKVMGEGFTWETQDRERDIEAAKAAWSEAITMMADPKLHLVVMDELNIVLRKDYLAINDVVKGLLAKRPDLHVVVTGRNAKPELIEAADLVTEMTLVKHPFRSGVKAQLGIEF